MDTCGTKSVFVLPMKAGNCVAPVTGGILLLLFSLHLKFLDDAAQDISLKSLQSSSAGLQSVHQWVQEAAKDIKRISEGTARGILVLNLCIVVCSYCSASVCCLSPWQ